MPEPTPEQIEPAARAIFEHMTDINGDEKAAAALTPEKKLQTTQEPTQEQIEAAARALKALAALTPEQQPNDNSYAEVSTDDIKRMNEHAKDAAYTPEKRREE